MLNINGSLQIMPVSIAVDTGTINVPDETGKEVKQQAIILGLETTSGLITVIVPSEHGENIGKGIVDASMKANAEGKGIQVVKSLSEAEKIAEAKNAIDNKFKQ